MDRILRKRFPTPVHLYLSEFPADEMFEDTLSFLEEACSESGVVFHQPLLDQIQEDVCRELPFMIAFHGCRPANLDPYFKKGILPLSREGLAQMAHARFGGRLPLEELQRRAAGANLNTRLGYIYFSAEHEDFLLHCGHYMIYGPEALNCLWNPIINEREKALFRECQERSRHFGVPTIFKCELPLALIDRPFLDCVVKRLMTDFFRCRSAVKPSESSSKNFGIRMSELLPAKHILSHWHPEEIRDPLRHGITYRPPVMACSHCR